MQQNPWGASQAGGLEENKRISQDQAARASWYAAAGSGSMEHAVHGLSQSRSTDYNTQIPFQRYPQQAQQVSENLSDFTPPPSYMNSHIWQQRRLPESTSSHGGNAAAVAGVFQVTQMVGSTSPYHPPPPLQVIHSPIPRRFSQIFQPESPFSSESGGNVESPFGGGIEFSQMFQTIIPRDPFVDPRHSVIQQIFQQPLNEESQIIESHQARIAPVESLGVFPMDLHALETVEAATTSSSSVLVQQQQQQQQQNIVYYQQHLEPASSQIRTPAQSTTATPSTQSLDDKEHQLEDPKACWVGNVPEKVTESQVRAHFKDIKASIVSLVILVWKS